MRNVAIVIGVLLGTVACDGCRGGQGGPRPGADASPSTSTSTNVGPSSARKLRAWGSVGKIYRAIRQYPIDEGERAELGHVAREVEDAERMLVGDAAPTADTLASLQREVATGVKAGKVDMTRLDAEEKTFVARAHARHERNVVTLNKVQRLLKAPHRTSIAQSIRSADQKRGSPKADERRAEAGHIDWERMRLQSFVRELVLTPDQQKSVDASYPPPDAAPSPEAATKQLEALLLAFEQDGFDANHFELDDADPRVGPFFRLARFAARIAPTLEPAQREKLAAKLLESRSTEKKTSSRYEMPDDELGDP